MTEDNRPHSRACGWRIHEHGPACCNDCPTCRDIVRSAAPPLTWQEQQEVLVLLRYWWEFHRGGLPMDEAVLLFTKALLDKHPARS